MPESAGPTAVTRPQRAARMLGAVSMGVSAAATAVAVAIFAWISRAQTPMADDFQFLVRARDSALLPFLKTMYLEVNGRTTPTAISWALISRPRAFAVLNTAVLLGIVVLAFYLAMGRRPRREPRDVLLLLVLFCAFWFGSPMASETLVWRVGAFNYSWVLVLALMLLVPFRAWMVAHREERKQRSNLAAAGLLLLLGVLVGWSHEQLAAAVAWMVLAFFVFALRTGSMRSVPIQLYAGAVGLLSGLAALVLSPGSRQRLLLEPEWVTDQRFAVFRGFLVNSFDGQWRGAYPWLALLLVLGLTTALSSSVRLRPHPAFAWLSGALLVLLPLYRTAWLTSARATFVTFAFVVIGLASMLAERDEEIVLERLGAAGLAILCVLISGALVWDASAQYRSTAELEKVLGWRTSLVLDAARAGGVDVLIPAVTMPGRRLQYVADFSSDPDHWVNAAAAEYYGVKSIAIEVGGQ